MIYILFLLQLRTINSVAHLDTLQEAIQGEIKSLEQQYGATAETLIEGLQQDLTVVKRQRRLGLGKLAEANFHLIRVRQQVIRDSYINKNLSKLVSLITVQLKLNKMEKITMKSVKLKMTYLHFTHLFIYLFQSPESKFRIRQSEVSTAGLFSDVELFKTHVGPTAKPSPHDKWLESTAALTKAVAACTKAATQKTAAKKPPNKQQAAAKKPATNTATTPGGGRKRSNRSRGQKGKKGSKPTSASAAAAATTKKVAIVKPADAE